MSYNEQFEKLFGAMFGFEDICELEKPALTIQEETYVVNFPKSFPVFNSYPL